VKTFLRLAIELAAVWSALFLLSGPTGQAAELAVWVLAGSLGSLLCVWIREDWQQSRPGSGPVEGRE